MSGRFRFAYPLKGKLFRKTKYFQVRKLDEGRVRVLYFDFYLLCVEEEEGEWFHLLRYWIACFAMIQLQMVWSDSALDGFLVNFISKYIYLLTCFLQGCYSLHLVEKLKAFSNISLLVALTCLLLDITGRATEIITHGKV